MEDTETLNRNYTLQMEDDCNTHSISEPISKLRNSNLMELQISIRALVNERKEIQSRLNGNKGRQRLTAFSGNNGRGVKRDYANKILDRKNDEERLNPRVATKPSDVAKPAQENVTKPEIPVDAFPVEKRPKVTLDDSSIKRNRNLFGSLLGHLKKAKICLDSEKTTRAAELQQQAEQQVIQKLALERKNLAELRRRDYQDRQRNDLARMRDLQKELHCKEMEILSLNLQNHFILMKNFIRTETLPMLFWIPGIHNKETERLSAVTSKQIQDKVESLAFKFMDSSGTSDIQNDLLSGWNGQPIDNKCDSENQKNETTTTHKSSCANAVATVHPDLINDSDEEEEDEKDQQQNGNIVKKEKDMIFVDSNDIKEEPNCSFPSPSLLAKETRLDPVCDGSSTEKHAIDKSIEKESVDISEKS
ncbi:uncharacterized protein LOC128883827 [Hylaeus volcanicus]|uniref:uncharacterized protein LOC128883827 n=1 Tax=Hylaeus volcanicus TaxID=313075 RepID=UPI0023B7AE63|nr:uncharacterized protein LOC128883827 [Hylaeus volcanicus]XP_053992563.1 uncharacterized protein LOC128883827 [Hylaeus volcanicus]XP_053992564.1 uncharacterized protein LOC128883827 [Hylaeus volcanicus]XP_053992565.1 uncharacterized protein LOC128883827 [Hylaeus volcanicus]XP_053992566.1 uncharacterized protein LOC128883827 [Hylaeus volcanicus]XP_053992568.1 uncharacterized protein LOC128883827 [Hylaeus volcanicus]XP_053992569.1 uncharacterized protein LOC128883827 [Hylaeus volcanicus]